MTREQAETKAIEVLKALQKRTEIDYCGLFESEVINLIADNLEVMTNCKHHLFTDESMEDCRCGMSNTCVKCGISEHTIYPNMCEPELNTRTATCVICDSVFTITMNDSGIFLVNHRCT